MVALAGEGATVGVLPTASGVPEESGPGTVEDFAAHGVSATVIDVNFKAPQEAANPEKAAQIAAHRAIWFTGGVQSRIIDAFRPATGDTVGYTALAGVLAGDGVIGGTSAGAAMMSDPCILWGNSSEALLIGLSDAEDRGVLVGRGMGFFPYGLTDQHFVRRGRLGRLVVALMESGVPRGFGVEENSALQVDLETHTLTAVGNHRPIVYVDVSEATRVGLARTGIRVSVLGNGDTINGITGKITRSPSSVGLELSPLGLERSETHSEGKVWESHVVPDLLDKMVEFQLREIRSSDTNFDVIFRADSRSVLALELPDNKGMRDGRIYNVIMDILPKEHAEEARLKLMAELATEGATN
jgi:cyanophycinase